VGAFYGRRGPAVHQRKSTPRPGCRVFRRLSEHRDQVKLLKTTTPSTFWRHFGAAFIGGFRDRAVKAWPQHASALLQYLPDFSALTLLVGRQEEHPACKMGVGVVICLERGAECLYMVQLMPLQSRTPSPPASYKILNPDWFYLSCTGLPRSSYKRGR